MATSRKDALRAAAVVGLASLVSGEANIRDGADNFGKERRLQYIEESWYDIPDPMHNQPVDYEPVHYEQQPIYYGGEIMPEAKAHKETHGNDVGFDGKSGKTDVEVEPYWMPEDQGSSKTAKTHVEGSSKTSKTHVEEVAPSWIGWHPSGKVEKMHPEEEGPMLIPKAEKMHPEEEEPMLMPKADKHPEEERPRWSGFHPSGKVEKEPVTEVVYPTEASGWWSADSGKTDKSKSAKAKSAKTAAEYSSSEDDDWWASSEDILGSMQTTVTAATMPVETTHIATLPAAKGAKEDEEMIVTTSTWWAVPEGSKTQKSGKSSKSGKSGKTGKTGKSGESWSWDSTWSTPTPCGKAEDCEHLIPTIEVEEHTPSEEHIDEDDDDSTPPTMSPVTPLVPVTMAPQVGQTRAVPTTSSPTTLIHALTSEAGWFQSGKEYETEELAYKRERVEGLAKQMEWKNSSSRPQAYPYLAVGAAAGLFFMLC